MSPFVIDRERLKTEAAEYTERRAKGVPCRRGSYRVWVEKLEAWAAKVASDGAEAAGPPPAPPETRGRKLGHTNDALRPAMALSYVWHRRQDQSACSLAFASFGQTCKGLNPEAKKVYQYAKRRGWIGPASVCPLDLDNPDRELIGLLWHGDFAGVRV